MYFTKEDSIPVSYITAKLEDAAELTTQTITYTSRLPMSDGSMPFITKKSFVMYYNATLRAGVDLSDVEVKERGSDKIVVKLPHATVLGSPNIDPNSINEYYGAAEPPVRCGESHLSGLTEPPHFVY